MIRRLIIYTYLRILHIDKIVYSVLSMYVVQVNLGNEVNNHHSLLLSLRPMLNSGVELSQKSYISLRRFITSSDVKSSGTQEAPGLFYNPFAAQVCLIYDLLFPQF